MQFQVGNYQLHIKKTARKGSIALKVTADEIALMVPKNICDDSLYDLITAQQDWLCEQIEQQRGKLPDHLPLEKRKKLMLFDRLIDFKIDHQTLVSKVGYQFEADKLTLYTLTQRGVKDPNVAAYKQFVSFMSEQLQAYLEQKLPGLVDLVGAAPTEVTVKGYKSRWGSCYPDGRVQFNWRLAMTPSAVVDYVIIHELCHLKQANHSPAYWALVAEACPDYEQHKTWLKQRGGELIAL